MFNKYLKYKNKYLSLKNDLVGGAAADNKESKSFDIDNLSQEWAFQKFKYDPYEIKVAHHDFKNSNDRNLVFLGGFSTKSFNTSMQIITNKLDKLGNKFGSIYGICLDAFKNSQTEACKHYSERVEDCKDRDNNVYDNESNLNKDIASIVNNIVDNLKLKKISLLGKCAGGGVSIFTACSGKYDALYLAVPGNPKAAKPLLEMSKEKLNEMEFIFSWNEDDEFKFNWGKSTDEKNVYDTIMKEQKNYKSFLFKQGGHDVSLEFIDKIIHITQV